MSGKLKLRKVKLTEEKLLLAEMDLLKRSSPYLSRVFCPEDGFSKSVFAFY